MLFPVNHAVHIQKIDSRIIEFKRNFFACFKQFENKTSVRLLFCFADDIQDIVIRKNLNSGCVNIFEIFRHKRPAFIRQIIFISLGEQFSEP